MIDRSVYGGYGLLKRLISYGGIVCYRSGVFMHSQRLDREYEGIAMKRIEINQKVMRLNITLSRMVL
jgi:hypothetical protein